MRKYRNAKGTAYRRGKNLQLTRKVKNSKTSEQTYSKNWPKYGGSLKACFVDADFDGINDSVRSKYRSPALSKDGGDPCHPVPPKPVSGPTNISASVLPPVSGPTDINAAIVVPPVSGPTNISASVAPLPIRQLSLNTSYSTSHSHPLPQLFSGPHTAGGVTQFQAGNTMYVRAEFNSSNPQEYVYIYVPPTITINGATKNFENLTMNTHLVDHSGGPIYLWYPFRGEGSIQALYR